MFRSSQTSIEKTCWWQIFTSLFPGSVFPGYLQTTKKIIVSSATGCYRSSPESWQICLMVCSYGVKVQPSSQRWFAENQPPAASGSIVNERGACRSSTRSECLETQAWHETQQTCVDLPTRGACPIIMRALGTKSGIWRRTESKRQQFKPSPAKQMMT